MVTRFTEGPWMLVPTIHGGNGYRYGVEPQRCGWWVAAICNPSNEGNEARMEADAALISAAPEMYEALEAAANLPWIGKEYEAVGDLIEAALAKARGEA